ncbi:hypothetical protein H2198_007175 [Neophaeococcomyces mojaviensis]|uniref:Uncharacterized protein n=1 Tax=Neophaeococcomyces mojaviensis TaxID=3383035 RepID=A0ACC3A1E3_9EURO|nr:hypothetical protein H2198_007175 [Knufia sp. JES_112]
MPKSASFDVLGTCFHFEPVIDVINSIIKRNPDINTPIDATTLFHSWFYAAQRDFTYTSTAGSYQPIAGIFRHTFRRACAIVDFPDVEKNISDTDIEMLMTELQRLPARDGLKECFDGLKDAGFDVYAVTNGGKEASLKYYRLADIELDADHLLSCDDIKAAKPDPKVYANANEWLQSRGCEATADVDGKQVGQRWFVAAHSWDLLAARKAGFRTAWVAHEEHDPVTQVFGDFDVYAKDLKECFEKIKAAS